MNLRNHFARGQVIPAFPLALDADRKLSEKHQRALARYYFHAGCGGLAVGVHSTQFEIREPEHALFEPVLRIASETLDAELREHPRDFVKVAGICGDTAQASREAELAAGLGFHAGLLSLTAVKEQPLPEILEHCRKVAEVMPVIGFYLQPAVGGRVFPYAFWREFMEIENVLAVKIAPFNRYFTQDVVRAAIEAGRDDVSLYTGNDDNIIVDLLTPFTFQTPDGPRTRTIAGGLLGQWGVWTRKAVLLLEEIKQARREETLSTDWLTRNAALTDINAAVFDVANGFAGVIPGIHEVLRRQGLLPGTWCLNPDEKLSPGQSEELDRVTRAYPEFVDDDFVREHLDAWLK